MPRFLVVAAFPYINGVKHLGNLAGSMLPADVSARFRRLQGHEVLFVCGTDDHGSTAELAAIAASMPVAAYCDAQHAIQKQVCDGFCLSFDWFGRTSSLPNHRLAQQICERLEAQGLVEERTVPQVYSRTDRRFLADRLIGGICPYCGYQRARGDQCENCARPLEPEKLRRPRSSLSGTSDFEMRDTVHLYLLQTRLRDHLRAWVDGCRTWSSIAKSIAATFLDRDLADVPITRDLSWGIPVTRNGRPRPGYEEKVFYFWFDAPLGPIGATIDWSEATGADWQRWWRTDAGAADVVHMQFVGKDNVPFLVGLHSAAVVGTGEPWKRIDCLKAFHWLTWYGGKFSTSRGHGLFMDQALDLLPCDYWRWYLLANAPERHDTRFTLEHFRDVVHADLVNTFGNLVHRTSRLCASRYAGTVPRGGAPGPLEAALTAEAGDCIRRLTERLEALEFRKAAVELRRLWVCGNRYLQAAVPWSEPDGERMAVAVRTGLNLVRLAAILTQPFMPCSAGRVLDALAVPAAARRWPAASGPGLLDALPHGAAVRTPGPLFARIDDRRLAEWGNRFGAGLPIC